MFSVDDQNFALALCQPLPHDSGRVVLQREAKRDPSFKYDTPFCTATSSSSPAWRGPRASPAATTRGVVLGRPRPLEMLIDDTAAPNTVKQVWVYVYPSHGGTLCGGVEVIAAYRWGKIFMFFAQWLAFSERSINIQ